MKRVSKIEFVFGIIAFASLFTVPKRKKSWQWRTASDRLGVVRTVTVKTITIATVAPKLLLRKMVTAMPLLRALVAGDVRAPQAVSWRVEARNRTVRTGPPRVSHQALVPEPRGSDRFLAVPVNPFAVR